jgi:hypothetical protein
LTAVILGALWLAGVWEWTAFAKLSRAAGFGYTLLFTLAMALVYAWPGDTALLLLMIVALGWWAFAFVLVLRYPQVFGSTFVAVAGIVVLLPSWALLVRLHREGAIGAELAFTVLALVWAADVGAYAFGRRPHAEHVQAQRRAQGQRQAAAGPRRGARPHRQPHGRRAGLRRRPLALGPVRLSRELAARSRVCSGMTAKLRARRALQTSRRARIPTHVNWSPKDRR